MHWKCSNPNCNGSRREKVALKTTWIKFKIIKIRTGCQYVGYFYYSENLNWAVDGPRVGHSWSMFFILLFFNFDRGILLWAQLNSIPNYWWWW